MHPMLQNLQGGQALEPPPTRKAYPGTEMVLRLSWLLGRLPMSAIQDRAHEKAARGTHRS